MEIAGHLDLCGPALIEGWLYSDAWQGETIRLQVYIGKQLIGECKVDRFRQDLKDAGYGDGRCGFSFSVPSTFGPLDFAETRLRLLGSPVYMLPSEDSAIAAPMLPELKADEPTSSRSLEAVVADVQAVEPASSAYSVAKPQQSMGRTGHDTRSSSRFR